MTRRLLGLILVSVLLVLLCSPTANAQTPAAARQLRLVRQTAFVGPTGTFSVTVATGDLPTDTRLALVIYGEITTRSRLDRTIAGEQLGAALFTTPVTPTVAGTPNTTLTLPIADQWPAPEGGTVLSGSGVYPVLIEARSANGTRLDSVVTHLLRLPSSTTPTTPLSVGATVVIDAPLGVSLDGTPQFSDAQRARASEQFRALTNARPTPLTLAATPLLAQSLIDAGDTSARLDAQSRQTLSRPYVAIDAGSLNAAGRGSTITQEYALGNTVLGSIFQAIPDQRTLVIDPTVSPSALDRLAETGARSVVVQSSQIRSSLVNDEAGTLTSRFVIESETGAAFAAMASDDTASSRFILTNDPILGAHNALAELMMLHKQQPGPKRGVAITIPAATEVSALTEFLRGLGDVSGAGSGSIGNLVIEPVTLDDLFSRTIEATNSQRPVVRSWTSDEPTDLGFYPMLLEQAQWDLIGLRAMLPEGADLVAPIERTVLASAEATLDTGTRVAVLENSANQLRALTSAISLPESQKVTLTSSSGKIPLVITNALPIPALVRITVSSAKLEFPEGTTYEISLAPSSTTRTDIAVTTKASGAFPLDVNITSAGGGLPVVASRIDVRSTAISGFGLFISIGAGVFLLLWWGRHFRRTRRARALVETDEPSLDSGG